MGPAPNKEMYTSSYGLLSEFIAVLVLSDLDYSSWFFFVIVIVFCLIGYLYSNVDTADYCRIP